MNLKISIQLRNFRLVSGIQAFIMMVAIYLGS
jgi:hypothetical protein